MGNPFDVARMPSTSVVHHASDVTGELAFGKCCGKYVGSAVLKKVAAGAITK